MNPAPLTIKIFCVCGQKYAFEVHPHAGRMPVPVACPVCARDGTDEANRLISRTLNGETRKLPPQRVNALLNSALSSATENTQACPSWNASGFCLHSPQSRRL